LKVRPPLCIIFTLAAGCAGIEGGPLMGRPRSFLLALLVLPVAARYGEAAESANPSLTKEVESYLQESAPAAEGGDAKAVFTPGKMLTFSTADKAFSIHFGGRLFWDNGWVTSNDFPSAQTQDTSYFRAARLSADGTMFTNAFFKVEADFASSSVVLRDVYLGLRKLGAAGTLTAGHFKEPFSLEELNSNRFMSFMERAAATSAFAPSRNNGFMIGNNFLEDGLLGAWIGFFRTVNDQGNVADDGSYALTLRVAAFFLEDKDSNRVVHVGFCYSFRNMTNDTAQVLARPDTGFGPRFVDTGTFAANDESLFAFELLLMCREFHVQAEFYLAEFSGAGGPEPTFSGWYVEVGWFAIGGRRTYSKDKKTIDRPRLERTLHAGDGGLGAWQLSFRYDSLDLTDSGIAGGVQDCLAFGVNWYWNLYMRVMFNVIWADISDGGPFGEGELTMFTMRFQVDF
jgi:phosphate-selective porin OprO/OprP